MAKTWPEIENYIHDYSCRAAPVARLLAVNCPDFQLPSGGRLDENIVVMDIIIEIGQIMEYLPKG